MEQTKTIIAWEILGILVFASLLIIGSTENITGMAVQGVTQDSILKQIEQAAPKFDFIKSVNEASVCLVVSIDQATKYSYEIVKIGEAVAVTSSSSLYCKGQDKEDFILYYPSYEKLNEQLTTIPSLSQLKATGDGTNFYLYPSKQILSGPALANAQEFNEKFGDAMRKNLKAYEVQQILNPQTAAEEQAASYLSYWLYLVIGIVVLIVVIVVLISSKAKKPEIKEDLELTAYLKSALAQGYEQEQIVQILVQNGWDEKKVRQAFESISSQATFEAM